MFYFSIKGNKEVEILDKKGLGEKIKNRRKQLKMTQFELAEKIGLHEKHISRIESGQNYPNLESFFKMLEVLDLKMSDFDQDCELAQGKTRDDLNYKINLILLFVNDRF